MEKANINLKMEVIMMVNGEIIKWMEKVIYILRIKLQNILDNGNQINIMVGEF